MVPTLETARLLLRPIRLEDASRVQLLFDDIEVTRYLDAVVPWPYPADGAQTFVESVTEANKTGNRFVWAITERGNDELIGVIEVSIGDRDNRGFWLAPPFHRRGYITEAVAVVNDFYFDELKQDSMRLGNAEPNRGSSRIKEKSGATLVEVKPGNYVGGTFPSEVWSLTAEQWRANRAQFLGLENV